MRLSNFCWAAPPMATSDNDSIMPHSLCFPSLYWVICFKYVTIRSPDSEAPQGTKLLTESVLGINAFGPIEHELENSSLADSPHMIAYKHIVDMGLFFSFALDPIGSRFLHCVCIFLSFLWHLDLERCYLNTCLLTTDKVISECLRFFVFFWMWPLHKCHLVW